HRVSMERAPPAQAANAVTVRSIFGYGSPTCVCAHRWWWNHLSGAGTIPARRGGPTPPRMVPPASEGRGLRHVRRRARMAERSVATPSGPARSCWDGSRGGERRLVADRQPRLPRPDPVVLLRVGRAAAGGRRARGGRLANGSMVAARRGGDD